MHRCDDRSRGRISWGILRSRVEIMAATLTLFCVVNAGVTAAQARASSAPADFSLQFNTQASRSLAAIRLHILYKDPQHPDDPNSPPPPLTSVTIKAPPGTVFDGSAVPACHASDQELMLEGKAACPAGSVVGGGTGSVILGTPPATTTAVLDATLINYGQGIIELFTDPNTGATAADDRASFNGPNTMVLHPPVDPGVTEREFSFTYDAVRGDGGKAFITTPPSCPASRLWTSTLDYTVSTGASYSATSTSACAAAVRRSSSHARHRAERPSRRHHSSHPSPSRRPSFTG